MRPKHVYFLEFGSFVKVLTFADYMSLSIKERVIARTQRGIPATYSQSLWSTEESLIRGMLRHRLKHIGL